MTGNKELRALMSQGTLKDFTKAGTKSCPCQEETNARTRISKPYFTPPDNPHQSPLRHFCNLLHNLSRITAGCGAPAREPGEFRSETEESPNGDTTRCGNTVLEKTGAYGPTEVYLLAVWIAGSSHTRTVVAEES